MIALDALIAFFDAHRGVAYLILFFGSYFETLIGPSFFLPGEIFFLSGAILAGAGHLNIWLVSFACIFGGVSGDSTSFWIGRAYGERIVRAVFKKGRKYLNEKNYERAKRKFLEQGVKFAFFARLLGPLSWITPFIAGTLQAQYAQFLMYNVPGAIVGIGQFMVVGYLFGFSYGKILPLLGEYTLVSTALFVACVAAYLLAKRYLRARSPKKG